MKTIIAGALAFLVSAGAPVLADDTPPDGAGIVKARCLACHNADRLKQLAARTPEAEREAKWARFLKTHNLPSEADRAAVIPHLLELAR